MTTSGVSNNSTTQQAWQAKMQQRKQDFSQLSSALQSGDLASAQKAFADLQSLKPVGQAQSSTDNSGSGSSNSNTPDFSQLAALLQSNDLASLLQSGGTTDTNGSNSSASSMPDLSQFASLLQGGDLSSILQSTGTTDNSGNATPNDFSSLTLQGVSNNISIQSLQAKMQQQGQGFDQLSSALQSGDLASALKAFADLQSLSPSGQAPQNTTGVTNSSSNSGNTTPNDFAALGQALQSGNLTDAQNAFAKVQADMQAHKVGHHHHGGAAASYANVNNQTQSTASPVSTINIPV